MRSPCPGATYRVAEFVDDEQPYVTHEPWCAPTMSRHGSFNVIDRSCYHRLMNARLADVARESDAAIRLARRELVRAVREAAAAGMTQAQIAVEIGRSQPEVSRLLRFHGTTPLARRLRASRGEVLRVIGEAGGTKVRVFGSVARNEDGDGSDVDLVFAMGRPLSLMELGRLEDEVSAAVGVPVDLVPESSLRPAFRDRVLADAVPL